MTDVLSLIVNLSPLILLIVVPIVTVRALDTPGVHVPESGATRAALAPAVPEPEPPRWRFERLTLRTGEGLAAGSRDARGRLPHPTGCIPA